jgi:predicted nucleotidyltransferase
MDAPTRGFDQQALQRFSSRWGVSELTLFGSVLRNELRPDSDIDVLVSFRPGTCRTLFALVHMEEELKQIFGRAVDLVERDAVEHSENYIRRRHILEHCEPIYVAR